MSNETPHSLKTPFIPLKVVWSHDNGSVKVIYIAGQSQSNDFQDDVAPDSIPALSPIAGRSASQNTPIDLGQGHGALFTTEDFYTVKPGKTEEAVRLIAKALAKRCPSVSVDEIMEHYGQTAVKGRAALGT